MTVRSLESRANDLEDSFVERKAGLRSHDEIRKAVVSFANSLREGETAVLFIGIADDGSAVGVPANQAGKIQQSVRRVCEDDCFPPIAIQVAKVLTIDGKHVVAFEFGPSSNRPHFAGHAYLRVGAESIKASELKLDELIASRNTTAGRLLAAKHRHESVLVIIPDRALIPGHLQFSARREWECTVEDCDAHVVKLQISMGRFYTLPLEFLVFGKDPNRDRLLIEYTRVR